jgi:hypothetical protein
MTACGWRAVTGWTSAFISATCVPTEFLTVLAGGADGLHHGLWYDDPAELPSFIAHNYARDSAETWASQSPTLLADGQPRWATAARHDGWISVSPALPEGSGDPRLAQWDARYADFWNDEPAAARWIGLSEEELAAGQPALALAVGSELHWLGGGHEPYRRAARDLRAGAYRALGRDALAEIVDVHAAHPGLKSVQVLTLP